MGRRSVRVQMGRNIGFVAQVVVRMRALAVVRLWVRGLLSKGAQMRMLVEVVVDVRRMRAMVVITVLGSG